MNRKHLLATILLSGIATLLQSIISFLVTPLVIKSLGVEAYGYVTLAKNFASYADILMIALNSYAARYISISYLKGDNNSFQKYYSTVFYADIILGGSILAVGTICVFNLERIINIPLDLVHDVKVLFFLTFIAFFLTTMSTVFAATAYVKNKLNIYNANQGLKS